MQNNSSAALDLIIRWEGPEVNISSQEPGGISKYGISLTTYADYCKKNNLGIPTFDTISNLTESDARNFYSLVFLPAVRFNDLPTGVDVRLADIAVNLGITGGINQLQMVLGQYPLTGTLTDVQIQLLNTYDPSAVILALSAGWISNKQTHTSWAIDGHGWTNRNVSVTKNCNNVIQGKALDLS
jgi:lysozyme family protein